MHLGKKKKKVKKLKKKSHPVAEPDIHDMVDRDSDEHENEEDTEETD